MFNAMKLFSEGGRKFLIGALAALALVFPALAQNPGVTPAPPITVGHCVSWASATSIQDAGAACATLPAGVLTNNRIAKSANYTVLNTDPCGSTLALNSAFFTLTFTAASGYTANCAFYIINEDASRGKLLAINGYSNFILWPNQTLKLVSTNNVWRFISPPRFFNTTGLSIQVDPVNGSDTNNDCLGTTTGSCQSIPGAANLALKNFDPQGGSIGILLANGTYSTGLPYTFIGGTSGFFLYSIAGNTGQGANVIIAGQFAVKDYAAAGFREMTFNATAGSAIQVDQNGIVDVASTVTFGTGGAGASFNPISAVNGGVFNVSGGATFNLTSANILLSVRTGGKINMSSNISVTAAIAVGTASCFADTTGFIFSSGGTFTGAGVAGTTGTRHTVTTAGGISTGGVGVNYCPGSVAGTVTAPGWFQ